VCVCVCVCLCTYRAIMKFKEIKGEKLPKGPILESWLVVDIKKQKFVFFSQV